MSDAANAGGAGMIKGHVELRIGGRPLAVDVDVPSGLMSPGKLLPLAQGLCDVVIDAAVEQAQQQGRAISCRKGCGACCRQLVPVSSIEARAIANLVEQMPEPQRTQVRERFADARRRLAEAGLLEKLLDVQLFAGVNMREFGLKYLSQGIACPFLEEEACSIHPQRPTACREYLVTSPAADCANPGVQTIDMVKIPGKVSRALLGMDFELGREFVNWVPLVVATEWAAANAEAPPSRTGPQVLQDFLEKLSGKQMTPNVPSPQDQA